MKPSPLSWSTGFPVKPYVKSTLTKSRPSACLRMHRQQPCSVSVVPTVLSSSLPSVVRRVRCRLTLRCVIHCSRLHASLTIVTRGIMPACLTRPVPTKVQVPSSRIMKSPCSICGATVTAPKIRRYVTGIPTQTGLTSISRIIPRWCRPM